MIAAELDSADLAKLTVAEMLKRHILINCTSDTVLRFLPPYILERAHVDTAIAALDEIFTEHAARAQLSRIRRRTNTWLAKPPWNASETAVPVQKDPDILAAAARLAGEDMCSIADLSSAEVRAILKLGHDVKRNPREYRHALDAKQMVLMFEKASLRTRLSFETGINTMGGNAIFVDQTNSPLGERESIADVARNVERWVDVIVLRTYAHDTITEMAANSRVPVINALSDFEHPCQALADFMTLEEHFGSAAGLNFTYVGDGNNVCHSLMLTGAQLGANVTVATPRGYSPDIEIVTMAREMAEANGCEVRLLQDPQAAVEGADAVYTDVCVSMGFEHESTKRAPIFRPFQVNEALMAKAAPHAVFMHCLPARRNEEVTDAVLDSPQSIVFDQAENRLHAQKALLLLLLGGLGECGEVFSSRVRSSDWLVRHGFDAIR